MNKELTIKDLEDKEYRLSRITNALIASERQITPIQANFFSKWSIFTGIILICVYLVDENLIFNYWVVLVGVLVGFVNSYLYCKKSDIPNTYEELIDRLLTDYVPFDKENYNEIQEFVREDRYINIKLVGAWALREEEALKKEIKKIRAKNSGGIKFVR